MHGQIAALGRRRNLVDLLPRRIFRLLRGLGCWRASMAASEGCGLIFEQPARAE
jgi:hypothetical protein